jgi:hypothetical protein
MVKVKTTAGCSELGAEFVVHALHSEKVKTLLSYSKSLIHVQFTSHVLAAIGVWDADK